MNSLIWKLHVVWFTLLSVFVVVVVVVVVAVAVAVAVVLLLSDVQIICVYIYMYIYIPKLSCCSCSFISHVSSSRTSFYVQDRGDPGFKVHTHT